MEITVRLIAFGRDGSDEGGESAGAASESFRYWLGRRQTGHVTEVGQPQGVNDLTHPAPWHDEHTLVETPIDAVWLRFRGAASALAGGLVTVSARWLARCGLTTVGGIE
jgi:hypothetical protein